MFVQYDCVLTLKRLHLAKPSVVCQQVKLVSQKNPNILIMAQISSSFSKSSIFRVERADSGHQHKNLLSLHSLQATPSFSRFFSAKSIHQDACINMYKVAR